MTAIQALTAELDKQQLHIAQNATSEDIRQMQMEDEMLVPEVISKLTYQALMQTPQCGWRYIVSMSTGKIFINPKGKLKRNDELVPEWKHIEPLSIYKGNQTMDVSDE